MVTYAIIVSHETVRIDITIAALNGLQVKFGDVLNAYITAPVMELIWTTLGNQFSDDQDKTAIFVSTLYGLKSSGAAFPKHLGEFMSCLGYKTCLPDPDLSYILCCIDDILVVHHNARPALYRIDQFMNLKEVSAASLSTNANSGINI